MKISKKYFLIDTFSNGLYFGSKFIFNLIVYSLLINAFEIEQYGVYIFFATLLGQFEFIQSGFATSLLRFIPIYRDKKEIINLVSIVSLVYLFFGIVFSIIIGALSYLSVFNLFGFNNSWEYVKYLICFAPLVWFFKTFSIALKGSKDFRMENLINMIFLILELIIIFIMINYNYTLSDILFSVFFILFLKHLFHFFFYYSRHGFRFNLIDFYSLKNQFLKVKNFSFWNFISAFSGSIINQFDRVLVTIFLGPAALTIYYGISQFLKFYTSVLGVINSSVIPYFTKKITYSNKKTFNEIALKGTAITSYLGIILAGLLILFSRKIFSLLSKEYLLEYIDIFIVGLVLYVLVTSRSFLNKLFLCEPTSAKRIAIFGIITALIYPITLWILTSHFYIKGAIISTVVSHFIIFPFWVYFNFKITSLSVVKYFTKIFQNSIPIVIALGIFSIANEFFFKELNYLILITETLILLCITIINDYFKKESFIKEIFFILE